MRFGLRYSLLVLLLSAVVCGCGKQGPLSASLDKSYKDDIQKLVEEKIDEQSEDRSGAELWESYKRDDFQQGRDFSKDERRDELEKKRQETTQRLMGLGPLSLDVCLITSLEFNEPIQASRAAIRAVGGDELIAKSRFLPHLSYDLTASVTENLGRNIMMGFTATQVLLEFGKDNPIDVALRKLQRQELFRYEVVVADVLSNVRLRFYTILLRQQQLAQRRRLRDEFASRYEDRVKLIAAERVLVTDVLTARLNVLNEESRINALEKEILRQKMDLLKDIGLPVERTDFELEGDREEFSMSLQESVDIAFRRSTRIAQSRAWVFEQDRIVRQIVWEYFPTIRAQGGYKGNSAVGGVDLRTEDNVYDAGPFGERHVDEWNDSSFMSDPRSVIDERAGWYGRIDLTLPIFRGLERTGEFKRERALLAARRHVLLDTIRTTELDVGKAYETVLEQVRQTEISEQTVRISKERLRLQEVLKEQGKISDNQLETFRDRFFEDQDRYFEQQIRLIDRQERLRREMRYFEAAGQKEIRNEVAK